MMRTPLKNFFLFLTAAPVLIADVVAMDNTQNFNQIVNRLTERLALHAYNQTPDQNTLVSAVGPALQLLATSQSLCHLDNEDSAESTIKREIFEGLGIPRTTNVASLLDEGEDLKKTKHSTTVNMAHLHMIPQGPNFLLLSLAQPSSPNIIAADLDNPKEAADIANNWVKKKTQDGITKIADANDFRPTINQRMAHVFLSALFVKSPWPNPCQKTTMTFHSKSGAKLVPGFTKTTSGYVYESPAHLANPFTILYLSLSEDIYMGFKMHRNGSVSPITVQNFNEINTVYNVTFKVPFIDFSQNLDLTKSMSQLFPTMFSTPYQTTWAEDPAVTLVFRQENFIHADEVGVVAGSATMKADYCLAGGWGKPYEFDLNKPFSFLLFQKTDSTTSKAKNFINLFSGTVVDLDGTAVDLPALPNPGNIKITTNPIKAEKVETPPRKVETETHYTEIEMSLAMLDAKLKVIENVATELRKEMANIRSKYESSQQK